MVREAKSSAGKSSHVSGKKEMLLFLLIPTAVIVLVAAVLLIPGALARPKYDFVYSTCEQYDCGYDYRVGTDGRIQRRFTGSSTTYNQQTAQLYYHDTAKNASRPLVVTDTQALRLDNSNVSPDGYRLEQPDTGNGGFLFWGDSGDNNWYLVNGLKKKRMNLVDTQNYGGGVTFIGWVEK